ncbi:MULTISPECIES: hypothetical protein [Virgibacillus]|uniref:hypothetical protein n=1 Tax=Virgibacillus TaxID=84406 RepID=UPI00098BA7E2|nr:MULTISPECIES: hypothetical protein [Virgibacillus]NWO12107.1 hypothetical protein [Virgibacillus sp.]
MRKMELNYILNHGDIQKLAENYNENSTRAKRAKKWMVIGALVLSLILSAFPTLVMGRGFDFYLVLVLISFIITSILSLQQQKKDLITSTNRRLTKENIGLLGEYLTTISEDGIHATLFPNDPKKERNITNSWEEIDYYSKERNLFFVYVDRINFVYVIKAEEAARVDQFLNKKLPVRKNKSGSNHKS